jgi:hypothetical protein
LILTESPVDLPNAIFQKPTQNLQFVVFAEKFAPRSLVSQETIQKFRRISWLTGKKNNSISVASVIFDFQTTPYKCRWCDRLVTHTERGPEKYAGGTL